MKKAIALAIAMASATGANAAFDTEPYGLLGYTNYFFSAWEVDAGANAQRQSINVDLGINILDAAFELQDPSAFGTFSIDISALDSGNIAWTVFAIDAPAASATTNEYYTSGTGIAVNPNSFTQTIDAGLNWLTANENTDTGFSVEIGDFGTAAFGGNLANATRAPYQANGSIGDELFVVGYDRQTGLGTQVATVAFTGNELIFGEVATSEIPVPAAAWLFGSALVGLAGVARRRG